MQQISLADLAKVKGVGNKTIERVREFLLAQEEYVSEYNPALHIKPNSLNLGDCLELMNGIRDNSVDMILADLPYDATQNSWDCEIATSKLWAQYMRIAKPRAAIVLTSMQPFTTTMIESNPQAFKYCWTWDKELKSGHLNAKVAPMKQTEDIAVFCKSSPHYFPIMVEGNPSHSQGVKRAANHSSNYGNQTWDYADKPGNTLKYPSDLLGIQKLHPSICLHPTQKPVELFEYLIRTYTNEGDVILDNTAGVYTTAIAAINTNRQYICIEKEEEYHLMGSRWVDLVLGGVDYKEAMKQVKQEFSQE